MDIKDEASIINSDENVVSDVEQADLSINGDASKSHHTGYTSSALHFPVYSSA